MAWASCGLGDLPLVMAGHGLDLLGPGWPWLALPGPRVPSVKRAGAAVKKQSPAPGELYVAVSALLALLTDDWKCRRCVPDPC